MSETIDQDMPPVKADVVIKELIVQRNEALNQVVLLKEELEQNNYWYRKSQARVTELEAQVANMHGPESTVNEEVE